MITVTVLDNGFPAKSITRTFNVTVTPVNDRPTMGFVVAAPRIIPNPIGQTEPFFVSSISPGPDNERGQQITVSAVSDNPAVVPNPTVKYSNPSDFALVEFTPVPNSKGIAQITVFVEDDGGGTNQPSQTFTVVVGDILPKVSISDVTVTEGNSGYVEAFVDVTLSKASDSFIRLLLATADGTAGSTDYSAGSGFLTFMPGELTKQVRVRVTGDLFGEANETFFVNIYILLRPSMQ